MSTEAVRLFFFAYLAAYQFWLGVALGSLALLMLQYLTGGAWGLLIRRWLEAATRTLPLMALLFVPLLFGLEVLYPWTHSEGDAAAISSSPDEGHNPTDDKRAYLNVPFFLVRAGFYFAVWLALANFLNRWSRRPDEAADPHSGLRLRRLSAAGLAVYGLTVTFASIDWVMSLEPHWYSSIYGVLFGTGQVLSALAFAVVGLTLLARRPPLDAVVTPGHLHDLGTLLFAFVFLWAYMGFSQYLIIWSGNLPEEAPWYLRRSAGMWQVIAVLLLVFHFTLPFLLLLSKEVKRNPRVMAVLAAGLLVMRIIDLFWLIAPAAEPDLGPLFPLAGFAAVLLLGVAWLKLFFWQLHRQPLLPPHEPASAEAVPHG